jgi:hypothetical protein
VAPTALDLLIEDHDLTASVPGARFVRAGTAASTATHLVPEATPVLSSLGAGPWLHGSSSAAHGATSTPPFASSGAAAPVHPAQVAASGTTPTTSVIGPAALLLVHRLLPAIPAAQLLHDRSSSLRSPMHT